MTTENHEAAPDDLGFDEESPFLVGSEREIVQILRGTQERAALVTAYLGRGSDFALTSILEVSPDEDQFVFDVPSQPERTRKLIDSERAIFVTNQDGIRIKFVVEGVTPAEFDGRPALVARIPELMLRVQRREFYRVACPLSNQVKCTVTYSAGGETLMAELPVVDLSLGGLALMDQHQKLKPELGTMYEKAVVDLPGVGRFVTDLEVRSRHDVTLKSGQVNTRAGCRFVRPAANAQAMLQKYTMKLERELNARLGRG